MGSELFAEIKVLRSDIPAGARLVEAYETDKEVIVIGEPNGDRNHDCDQMGCTTFSHVMFRFPIEGGR